MCWSLPLEGGSEYSPSFSVELLGQGTNHCILKQVVRFHPFLHTRIQSQAQYIILRVSFKPFSERAKKQPAGDVEDGQPC